MLSAASATLLKSKLGGPKHNMYCYVMIVACTVIVIHLLLYML